MEFKKVQVQLLIKKKPFLVLQNVKDKYPNISTQSVILSQIKKLYLSDPNNRLPEYEIKIHELIDKYPEKTEIVEFSKKNPYEQDKIQKKIRNGKIVYSKEIDDLLEKIPLFDKDIDKYIKLPTKDSKILRRTQITALNDKHHNIKVLDGDLLMSTILPYLESDNEKERIVAVLLSTGRRQNELVEGTLSKSNCGPYFALFKGQSKTGLDLERNAYDIPLLAPFSVVKKAWDNSKKYFEETQNKEQFKIKIRNISRWLKKQKINVEKLHEFRSIYALICYQLFPTGKLSQMAYISSVLGETSINIASHYNSIRVENVKKLWITKEHKYDWKKSNNSHQNIVSDKIDEYIMNQSTSNNKKKITKADLGRISGKSQCVIGRFYEENKDEIERYNNSI